MRGAIESAALGLKPRHGVSNRKQKSISSNQILQISDPLISPPAPLRIPPGHLFKFLLLISFLMPLGTNFLTFLVKIMKMCSPPRQGAHFRNTFFTNIRVHDDVSVPKMASKSSLWGGRFRLVLLLKPYVLPTERKKAPPGKLRLASLASRMHFGWDFHTSILILSEFVKHVSHLAAEHSIIHETNTS